MDSLTILVKQYEASRHLTEYCVTCRLDSETGVLTMKQGMPKGEHQFKVTVTDPVWKSVISSVTVKVIYLEEEQVRSSGSLRLKGQLQEYPCDNSVVSGKVT